MSEKIQYPTIWLAGDSTCANKREAERPQTGWGEMLPRLLLPGIRVSNHAKNGRSTKSFLAEGRIGPILRDIQPGDWLFVQFGHNDEKLDDPSRGTDPSPGGLFEENLSVFANEARKRGALPVFLTPVQRRSFDSNGHINLTHAAWEQAMRRFGDSYKEIVLDVSTASALLFEKAGPDESLKLFMHLKKGESENYPNGDADNTHFCERGALEVAKLVVQLVKQEQRLKALQKYLV